MLKPVAKYDRTRTWTDEDVIAWAMRVSGTKNPDFKDSLLRDYRSIVDELRVELHIRLCCPEKYSAPNYEGACQ